MEPLDKQKSFSQRPAVHLSVSTAKDKGEKKLFGFAFTPLMREDGTTLSDESHELYVYKVWLKIPAVLHTELCRPCCSQITCIDQ